MLATKNSLRQDLDGDFALQSGVLGPVHLSHPTLTDLLSDLVMGDGLAYQRASRLLGVYVAILDL